MAIEPKKKFKYAVHLANPMVKELDSFLTESARTKSVEIPLRGPLAFPSRLFVRPTYFVTPSWADRLDAHFAVDGAVKSASSAGVLLLKCEGRVLGCTFGHGHVMLDDDKTENDFGLLVAANSLSDENVRLVEKANLGSVIRDATQSAGITRLQEFNVDRALSLVRKLSGHSKSDASAVSGASAVTVTSEKDIDQLHELGSVLIALYESTGYQKTAFAIIDKIKPVLSPSKIDDLDANMLADIQSPDPSFELGAPDIDTQPIGYLTISGSGKRTRYPDITLATFLAEVGAPATVDDLHRLKIVTHSPDGAHKIREWSVYKGLVGSLELDSVRYALNEGKWYKIEDAVRTSANAASSDASKGLDKTYPAWPIIGTGRGGKTKSYEIELAYNKRVCSGAPGRFLLFDQRLLAIPNVPGSGIEICDILDVQEKRLIHVKKSGRRSSVISHFLAQGLNSAKVMRTYAQVKDAFLDEVEKRLDKATADALRSGFPYDWTVEYKFGDAPTRSGGYTIPFFSRVTFDETKREIEALGYKGVEVSLLDCPLLKAQYVQGLALELGSRQ